MKTGRPAADPFVEFARESVIRADGARGRLEGLELGRSHFSRALVFLELEGNALAFSEAGEPCALDGGDVNEHVAAACFRLDKAVALLLVEPLNGAGSHVDLVFR